ncbi:polyglutamine-repeat protein pqn-41-like isoform X2 [Mastomys coucha]|uniref:polyglutamine-repeat protein pqn-41-like isoform X2 n=1 Tax=Mastomys coucha TaxID=35658 RepID=UPI001261940A|nr:polyglutamine-repeat protein pqn-41-like isoform X2 [Mastomys coucha]XP_031222561.1 polyglutamine-repeat protein pqn-41-like isoform X2 [Mastomys coucha]
MPMGAMARATGAKAASGPPRSPLQRRPFPGALPRHHRSGKAVPSPPPPSTPRTPRPCLAAASSPLIGLPRRATVGREVQFKTLSKKRKHLAV